LEAEWHHPDALLAQRPRAGQPREVNPWVGHQAPSRRQELVVGPEQSPAERARQSHQGEKSLRRRNHRRRGRPVNRAHRRESRAAPASGKGVPKRLRPANRVAAGKRLLRAAERLPHAAASRPLGAAPEGKFPYPVRTARGAVTLKVAALFLDGRFYAL
jgi:hypothetical protein